MPAGTLGLKAGEADLIIKAQFRIPGFVAYQGPVGGYFLMLHGGEPGPTGLLNAMNSSRRVALGAMTAGTGVNLGTATNAALITFSAVTGTGLQTYTHYTGWDHATSTSLVNFRFDGLMSGTVNAGGDFIFNPGGVVVDYLVDD